MKLYGIPSKLVTMISCFYRNFECAVLLNNNNETTDWFTVQSGVRQGCIISPMLFLVAIDWVMKNTTSDKARGIKWTLFSSLEDLDFADDIALLASRHDHMQEESSRLNHYGKQIGLEINIPKTKDMRINTKSEADITIDGTAIKKVEDFIYLGGVISPDDATKKTSSAD